MKIALISRNPENSPNMADKDAAILECVKGELEKAGADVTAVNDERMPEDIDVVCHMSRDLKVLEVLKTAERAGIAVLNSPTAVENCSRTRTMEILEKEGIAQPQFLIADSHEALKEMPYPAWIKRGEGWSCHKDDIRYAKDYAEAREAVEAMQERGIKSFVYTRHIEGDLIKFYGVEERYFSYCYPQSGQTKFGLEEINGVPRRLPFDADAMRSMVFRAAKATGLKIYGGDCIVNDKGEIAIIDLNDFPSFSAVREEAAKEIAKTIMNSITEQER